jgi:hypothetical protein
MSADECEEAVDDTLRGAGIAAGRPIHQAGDAPTM